MTVLAPADGSQLRKMLRYAVDLGAPCAVRYARGRCIDEDDSDDTPFDGNNIRLSSGKDVDIWVVGSMLDKAIETKLLLASDGIDAGIVDVTRPHPVDTSLYESGKPVFTIEDGVTTGGFGEQLKAELAGEAEVYIIAWPDKFIEHGSCDDLYAKYHLDSRSIAEKIKTSLGK